jgi:stage II sporulation protein D
VLLLKVAILTLFHPQEVTVNGIAVSRQGAQVQAGNRLQEDFKITGRFQIGVNPNFQRTYKGGLEITAKNNELQLILTTTEEDLVAATVSAESPPAAPPAALEAQAILARSWIQSSRGRHGEFDFCDTTHCQHFKEPTPAGIKAAKQTKGLILSWQGKTFAAAYSASCGGRTKTAAAIGWDDRNKYPYFEVECPVCKRHEPAWTRQFDAETAARIRAAPNKESTRLAIGRRSGWAALPSNNYDLTGFEVKGRGHGHGLGYCQRGGAGMAAQGSTPAAILHHHFPGTNIMSSR